MSLIDEALKRARLDAARQEAAKQSALRTDGPYLWTPPAEKPSTGRPLLLGLAAGGLGALLVGGLLFVVLRHPAPAGSPPRAAALESAGARPLAPEGEDPVAATASAAPAAPAAPARKVGKSDLASSTVAGKATTRTTETDAHGAAVREEKAERARAKAAEVSPPADEARAAAADAAPFAPPANPAMPVGPAPSETAATPIQLRASAPPPVASAPSAPAGVPVKPADPPAAPVEDGKTYVREAAIAGGSLKLSGIAFSDTQPVAVINGRVVAPGESIEGFTVSKIQAQRVELRGHGVTVYLALQ